MALNRSSSHLHLQQAAAQVQVSFNLHPSALLFDLDGVFYNDTQPIPGGAEVIAQLRAGALSDSPPGSRERSAKGVPFHFVTNTTGKDVLRGQKTTELWHRH